MPEVLSSHDSKALGSFAPKWIEDQRSELRRMLLEYVDRGLLTYGHQPLAKRLFKLAEARKDDELMGHFLVAFDASTRKILRQRTRYDFTTREYSTTQVLEADPAIPHGSAPTRRTPPVNGKVAPLPRYKSHLTSFTFRTRRYLQRRAWRYFREIGKKDAERYIKTVSQALALYTDETLTKPADLLSCWGLLHALYHHSPVIVAQRSGFDVADGRSLSELSPAPAFIEHWKVSPDPLFALLGAARARPVRRFAVATLDAHHAKKLPPLSLIRALLDSRHDEVQSFAAKMLESSPDLDKWTLDQWLDVLRIESPGVVHRLAALFRKHVAPERIDASTAIRLALSPLAPIGEIGLASLELKKIESAEDIRALLPLGEAGAQSVRERAIDWLIGRLEDSPFTTPYHARVLLDSPHRDVRERASGWIFRHESLRLETLLWSAMAETPYDDVRSALLVGLERVRPMLPYDSVRSVWASVILAVHRGHRAKPRAARQVAERVATHPDEADQLLPLLAILLRSLRAPERAAGLAAIATAVFKNPALRPAVSRHVPGIELFAAEA